MKIGHAACVVYTQKVLHACTTSVLPFFYIFCSQNIQIIAYINKICEFITYFKIGKKKYAIFYNKFFHFVGFQFMVITLKLKL